MHATNTNYGVCEQRFGCFCQPRRPSATSVLETCTCDELPRTAAAFKRETTLVIITGNKIDILQAELSCSVLINSRKTRKLDEAASHYKKQLGAERGGVPIRGISWLALLRSEDIESEPYATLGFDFLTSSKSVWSVMKSRPKRNGPSSSGATCTVRDGGDVGCLVVEPEGHSASRYHIYE